MACNLVKTVETIHKCAQESKADFSKHSSEAIKKNYTYRYTMDTCNQEWTVMRRISTR